MLYLLSGKSNKRKEYIKLITEKYSLVPQHIYDNDIQDMEITQITSTQTGLFGDKELYVIHNLCRTLDLKNILLGFAESENIFIFSEDSVTKPIIKVFEKHDSDIQDFGKEDLPAGRQEKKNSFNMFSLTDALGTRDKKKLWLLFQEAKKNGSPEEIHGILFWQIKNLALVKSSATNLPAGRQVPGMNPFVYKKTSGYAQKFSDTEIKKMTRDLVYMFHNRDMYSTLDIEIEKFILNI